MSPRSDTDPPPARLHVTAGGIRIELGPDVVTEVLATGRIVRVPGSGPVWLAGLAAWRGRVVTLIDAGRVFGTGPAHGPWMVVLKGLPVDTALVVDGEPRLAGAEDVADLVLDRGTLAAHAALQPGSARPQAVVTRGAD
jgi:hypothetical protein